MQVSKAVVVGWLGHGPTYEGESVDTTLRIPQNESVVWYARVTVPVNSLLTVTVPIVVRIVPDGLGKVTDAVPNMVPAAGGNGQRDHHRDDCPASRS